MLISGAAFVSEVEEGDDYMYWQDYNSYQISTLRYQVDVQAKMCFAIITSTGIGITEIDCKKLAQRPEWKKIINWVK